MKDEKRRAGFTHEVLMMNLAIFHLLLPVVALSSGHISILITIALICSAMMIFWIASQARKDISNELIQAHWQLAWKRCRLLLIGYAISAAIMGLAWLLTLSQPDENMKTIFLIVFSRIAVVPTIVKVLFVLETTALSQAKLGEFPKR